jgi:hypothetical protein
MTEEYKHSKHRQKLAQEIRDTVPMERIMAAASILIGRERGIENESISKDEIADWIATLNTRGLKFLRRMALSLIEEKMPIH